MKQARRWLGYIGVVCIVVLSLVPGADRPSTGAANVYEHFVAYGVVAALLCDGPPQARLRMLAFLCVLAIILEIGQLWVPGRNSAAKDAMSGSLGALCGWLLSWLGSRTAWSRSTK
jgi:VanZ family protein